MTKKIVRRIEDGMDRHDVLATTYQMRNFYKQFRDGFFTALDVMNYIQHMQIVKWCTKDARVLDVCCGRGLLLPLLRYHAPHIRSYTGVDIEPRNVQYLEKRVTDGKPIPEDYYPFEVKYVESNVAEMSKRLPESFDVIVYTSAIEHMHPEMGERSLGECRKVAVRGTKLILTCPNTPEDQDGYNTRYRAHVYEWKRSELESAFRRTGWKITKTWGLTIGLRALKREADRLNIGPIVEQLQAVIPSEWLCPVLAPLFPDASTEIGFIARAR